VIAEAPGVPTAYPVHTSTGPNSFQQQMQQHSGILAAVEAESHLLRAADKQHASFEKPLVLLSTL